MGLGSAFSHLKEHFRDKVNGEEWTLRRALLDRDIDKVRRMLEKNPAAADYDLQPVAGAGVRKPLHFAAGSGDVDMLDLLLQPAYFKGNIDLRDSDGATPLMLSMNFPGMVQKLLALGADPNAMSKTGNSPLAMATCQGNTFLITALLAAGADVNGPAGGVSPLVLASHSPSQIEVLKLLLSHNPDLTGRGYHGETALQNCWNHPNFAGLAVLLDAGVDPNTPDAGHGARLLQWTVMANHAEGTEKLLEKGADPTVAIGKPYSVVDPPASVIDAAHSASCDPAITEMIDRRVAELNSTRALQAAIKEMAAGTTAAISIKPIKLKLS